MDEAKTNSCLDARTMSNRLRFTLRQCFAIVFGIAIVLCVFIYLNRVLFRPGLYQAPNLHNKYYGEVLAKLGNPDLEFEFAMPAPPITLPEEKIELHNYFSADELKRGVTIKECRWQYDDGYTLTVWFVMESGQWRALRAVYRHKTIKS
jgi:hypothetical protein